MSGLKWRILTILGANGIALNKFLSADSLACGSEFRQGDTPANDLQVTCIIQELFSLGSENHIFCIISYAFSIIIASRVSANLKTNIKMDDFSISLYWLFIHLQFDLIPTVCLYNKYSSCNDSSKKPDNIFSKGNNHEIWNLNKLLKATFLWQPDKN